MRLKKWISNNAAILSLDIKTHRNIMIICTDNEHIRLWSEMKNKLYLELLSAVCNKYEHETRHSTALRYIVEHESSNSNGSKNDNINSNNKFG